MSSKFGDVLFEVSNLLILGGLFLASKAKQPSRKQNKVKDTEMDSLRKNAARLSPPKPNCKSTAAAAIPSVSAGKTRQGEPAEDAAPGMGAWALLLLLLPSTCMLLERACPHGRLYSPRVCPLFIPWIHL